MGTAQLSKSAAVRQRLSHPVIDSDGHTVEFEPGVMDYLRQIGGPAIVERYKSERSNGMLASLGGMLSWHRMAPEERRDKRATIPPWWALPTKNTLDRATAMLPKLMYERLDDMGLDVTVVYPTFGLLAPHLDDAEIRRAACRAFNSYHADVFREYGDRIIPVAVIPMHTPQEAVEELDYAVKTLGMKAVMLAGHVVRPIPYVARQAPELAKYAYWLDTFCLDSEYDYDPVWAKCVELKVAPTFHSAAMGWGGRTSISTYMYNHIGHFAEAGEALCKALFFGGVTKRFPTLKFAFLEGGVSTGARIYADLIARWKKRNPEAIENYNPANLNLELLADLCRRYGGRVTEGKLEQLTKASGATINTKAAPENVNDFHRSGVQREEDIRDLFIPHFYFGCEADDPMNATAFNTKANPFGEKLRAVFSSDIGHWDVPDMTEVTEEAYELVEHGVISEDDFREFVFTNPATLWTGVNPDFFTGTVVEKQIKQFMQAGSPEEHAAN
jgi:predicted TIM-barrel fold metal-dependent hydrolase